MSIYQCACGTSWELEIEEAAPGVIAKFHNEHHVVWEQRVFNSRKQFVNAMFGLPEDTEWAEREKSK